jgi:hypothetical protein
MKIYPLFNCIDLIEVDKRLNDINTLDSVQPVCAIQGQLAWGIQYLQATLSGPAEIWCYFDSVNSIYYLLNKEQNAKVIKASESICL